MNGTTRGMWLQVVLTSFLVWLGWMLSAGEFPKTRLVIASFFGWIGTWLVLKLYVLLRYGWEPMKSLRWDE